MLTDEQKRIREQVAVTLKSRVDRFMRWHNLPHAPDVCFGTELRLLRKSIDEYASTLNAHGIAALNEPDRKYDFKDCERCDGRGEWTGYDLETESHPIVQCPDCDGTGVVEATGE